MLVTLKVCRQQQENVKIEHSDQKNSNVEQSELVGKKELQERGGCRNHNFWVLLTGVGRSGKEENQGEKREKQIKEKKTWQEVSEHTKQEKRKGGKKIRMVQREVQPYFFFGWRKRRK